MIEQTVCVKVSTNSIIAATVAVPLHGLQKYTLDSFACVWFQGLVMLFQLISNMRKTRFAECYILAKLVNHIRCRSMVTQIAGQYALINK